MVGTDPFTRISDEAKPALYWPLLLKQSDVNWLAHTDKLARTVAGMLSLKKETWPLSLLLFCSWDRIYALMLIFTIKNRAICVSSSEHWHCETLLAYRRTHLTSPKGWMPPFGYLLSPCRGAGQWTSLLSLHKERSWIWTACRGAVLPVGGLQRPCRNHLFSSFWEFAGSGRTGLYM